MSDHKAKQPHEPAGSRDRSSETAYAVKADLHCHSTASAAARLGVQRTLALPECATPPQEVFELAKRRGMDFVTITDHDTIAGVLEIADDPSVFVSEELTAWFKGEPQAIHVLCFGISSDDHEWLQAHNGDVVACAEYLHTHEIACALAHPFFSVAAPLTAAHRRTLAELFPVWEIRNGTRPNELNGPAAIYTETHGVAGVGGSDDHAGIDIGRTFTEAPRAASPDDFLAHIRAGRVRACGEQGSAAKWAHSALVLAARAIAAPAVSDRSAPPDPRAILKLAEQATLERDGDDPAGASGFGPDDARRLLGAWLHEMDLDPRVEELLEVLQAEEFSHAWLERRARHAHEQKLALASQALTSDHASSRLESTVAALLAACLPAVPYIPAAAFLGRERAKMAPREGEPERVAVVADGLANVHGVAQTLARLRERGVDGHLVDVIGTDANVDRRLPAVAEVELPYYPGLKLGVPSLFAVAGALTERRYDALHVCAPGPAGIAAALVGRVMGLPLVGSYHTELQAYAHSRANDEHIEALVAGIVGALYKNCEVVLSPSAAADTSLVRLGIPVQRIRRWQRGVDTERFTPERRGEQLVPGRFNVLYVGRLSREKGVELLADAFLRARQRDPRLHLVLAGGGPEEELLRRRLEGEATFLGWVQGDELARVYASADLFAFGSTTDTFGQVILEAQASGLPVVAANGGGPAELIEDGRSGCLVPPNAEALANAIVGIARRPAMRRRLAKGALTAVRDRTWEHSFSQLAAGYAEAIARPDRAPSRSPRAGAVARAA
jgi:glycosyltransferase involved in cell wall biosynthesis/predicted metal-dependent phosphoesterase TrpH